ncbi:hypothetical protein [Brotaphodocola sp.]
MKTRLIIDGNAVYEIDEECEECQQKNRKKQEGRKIRCDKASKGGEEPSL